MLVTLTNDFHGTSATVQVAPAGQQLSASQQRRVEKALCGMDDCLCGTLRGPQDSLPSGWLVSLEPLDSQHFDHCTYCAYWIGPESEYHVWRGFGPREGQTNRPWQERY